MAMWECCFINFLFRGYNNEIQTSILPFGACNFLGETKNDVKLLGDEITRRLFTKNICEVFDHKSKELQVQRLTVTL